MFKFGIRYQIFIQLPTGELYFSTLNSKQCVSESIFFLTSHNKDHRGVFEIRGGRGLFVILAESLPLRCCDDITTVVSVYQACLAGTYGLKYR